MNDLSVTAEILRFAQDDSFKGNQTRNTHAKAIFGNPHECVGVLLIRAIAGVRGQRSGAGVPSALTGSRGTASKCAKEVVLWGS